jgi:cell pole-organizing protein PopZ
VGASFDDLAKAMIEGNARQLDQVVEQLLRPMLKTWLEGNLPQMVERLVREEIDRVSRGRR